MTNSYYLSQKELKKIKFGKIGKNCKISNLVTFIGKNKIFLGDNVRIDDFCVINGLKGSVTIGNKSHINSFCYLLGTSIIKIGKNCDISQGVKIYSKSDNYKMRKKKTYKAKVVISDNCIIGSNVVILPGSKLNKNVRIGALTLVNKEIRSNSLYFGKQTKKLN